MKLRNKKTGEIGNLRPYGGDGKIWVWIDNISGPEYRYDSLAELNEEWEDAPEEPKEFYWIDECGGIDSDVICEEFKEDIDTQKSIGNYFETEEEAKKVVEKLKAWKRLKDKGFRFHDWKEGTTYSLEYEWEGVSLHEIEDDLGLLFGGEE